MEYLLTQIQRIADCHNKTYKQKIEHGDMFNLFDVAVGRDELRHSAIIATLLDPHGNHGQGILFLKKFLDVCMPDFIFDLQGHISVETETATDDGRLDIVVSNGIQAIIIENKIDAIDQPQQLKRYNIYAERNYQEYTILYLTIDGREASSQSGDEVDYKTISYADDIVSWLNNCISACANKPSLCVMLEQYKKLILHITHQDMDTPKEMYELMVGHVAEIEELAKSMGDGYINYVYRKYVHDEMTAMAERHGFKLSEKTNINEGFYLYRPSWKKVAIRIYKDPDSKHYIGVHKGLKGTSEDMVSIEHRKLDCMAIAPTAWAPYGWDYLSPYERWEAGTGTLPAMMDGRFVKHIESLTLKIINELDQKALPMP